MSTKTNTVTRIMLPADKRVALQNYYKVSRTALSHCLNFKTQNCQARIIRSYAVNFMCGYVL